MQKSLGEVGSSQEVRLRLGVIFAAISRGQEAMANTVRPFMKPRKDTDFQNYIDSST